MLKSLIIALFAGVLLSMAVTGCNTVRGAGQDVEDTGAAIKNNTP